MQKAITCKQILCRTLISALILTSCSGGNHYVQFGGYAQGGVYSVKYNASGVDASVEAVQAGVDSILYLIDNTLSGYNKNSLLSRFNAGEAVATNDVFDDVLNRAEAYKLETGGALDCSAGPLFDIWGFGFSEGTFPDDADIAAAMKLAEERKAYNFNAIAQGYSCDLVAQYLSRLGIKDMLVDIGEIYCSGLNPSGKPWTIGIDTPEDGNDRPGYDMQGVLYAPLQPCGVVTSGNYRKFYIKDGKKYAHTIDPRIGRPVEHTLLSATVIAGSATDADAYATYCMVIGLDEARRFIESRDDLECYLIYDDGDGFAEWHSEGFNLMN